MSSTLRKGMKTEIHGSMSGLLEPLAALYALHAVRPFSSLLISSYSFLAELVLQQLIVPDQD